MDRTLHTYCIRPDGTKYSFASFAVESKIDLLPHQVQGLSFTATGYGKRIPTNYCVRFNGKWRRVYCAIYSNIGTCYIGKLSDNLIIR
jgi:hypothetical protein